MRGLVLLLLLCPLPVLADSLSCSLRPEGGGAPVTLSFEIDRRQFAPATSPNEPPRQVRSSVRQDGVQYMAEPFLMEYGVRGFWAEQRAGGPALLVIEADGASRMSDGASGQILNGQCEDVR
jgi:hypothetical protein